MFRITEDPSSGRLVQCLAKNYKNGSIVSVDKDVVGVMAAYSCNFQPSTVQGSLMMDPLRSEICWSTFKYFIILIVSTNYILCISWIIKCLIVDARCKHEDSHYSVAVIENNQLQRVFCCRTYFCTVFSRICY